MKTFYKINRYLRGYYTRLLLNLLLNACTAVFSIFSFLMLMPFLQLIFKADAMTNYQRPLMENYTSIQQYLSDLMTFMFAEALAINGKMFALGLICVLTFFIFLFKNLSRYLALFVLAPVKTGLASQIRERLFEKITHLDSRYFNQNRKGDLMTKLTHDVQEIEYGILFFLEVVLREPVTIVITFLVMLFISVKLTLFVLVVLPVSGYVIAKIGKKLKQTSLKAQQMQGKINTAIDEMITNNQIIKSNNIETGIISRFKKINKSYYKLNTQMLMRRDLSSPLAEFMGMAVVLLVLFFGGSMIINRQSHLQAEIFITYIVIFSQIIQPAKVFSNAFYFIQKGMASLERIETVLNEKNEIEDTPSSIDIHTFTNEIKFDNVGFSYETNPVLENISFTIKKGEKVALVGVSGAGKTTVAKLLMRFYDADSGNIFMDDINIKNIKLQALRNLIAWAPQHGFLFNDTIACNIALQSSSPTKGGEPTKNIDEARMQAAITLANLTDFLDRQPQHLQTFIGDGGIKLSGGEQQRIAIARAIYKNAPIVILDEATAHLDSRNEHIIQNALRQLTANKTVIVIAHRLATIQACDNIIVFENGKIMEQGTHQSLLDNRAIYYNLVQMQQIK
jgi:subfamily B ATP-binding cassette protein MsbA